MSAKIAACALVLRAAAAHADVPQLAPNLYERGNLRLAVACAGNGLVSPEAGLRVSVDGQLLEPLRVNDVANMVTDADGNESLASSATDVGYLATSGHHQLRIEAPDCEPEERDLDLSAVYAERVEGRLAALPELRGPTAAPNGFGFALGAVTLPFPATLASGTSGDASLSTSYTTDSASAQGVWLSTQFDRRNWTLAHDAMFAFGSVTGTVTSTSTLSGLMTAPGPFRYSASYTEFADALRFGARLPWRSIVLAAGSGIAGALVMRTSAHVDTGSTPAYDVLASPPTGADMDWWLPVWASLSLKPTCSWGVQALATYEVRPTALDASAPSFAVGVMWQPSAACSEPAGIRVSP